MRTNDFDAQNTFGMTEEQYDAALEYARHRFEEIEAEGLSMQDLFCGAEDADYADCPF